jgi:hypothetical protein
MNYRRGYPLPCFLKVFILKEVKVVCFDAVLEVLILKGVRGVGSGRSFELPVAGESALRFGENEGVRIVCGTKGGWHGRVS